MTIRASETTVRVVEFDDDYTPDKMVVVDNLDTAFSVLKERFDSRLVVHPVLSGGSYKVGSTDEDVEEQATIKKFDVQETF